MNFELSPDQKLLVDTAAAFARKQSPVSRLRELRADPVGWQKATWKQMGELGWLAMLFPEELGGFGASFVDLCLVIEQLGATLVPEPIVPSVVLAGLPLLRVGSDAQKQRWLAPLAAGDVSLALAWAERDGRYDAASVTTRAERAGAGWRLTGEKVFVLNGHAADALLVSARTSGGPRDREGVTLWLVEPSAPGVTVQPIQTMDGHHAAMVRFDGVELGDDARVGALGGGVAEVERALDDGAAASCSEGAGMMQTVLAMTTEYLRTREQFGVKIGSFQALQHRAVDMFVECELAKSMALLAAIRTDGDDADERRSAVSWAKAQLGESGRYVTQQATQLHGGVGVTDEHDVGLYFKRMQVLSSLYGDDEHHIARLGRLPSFTRDL